MNEARTRGNCRFLRREVEGCILLDRISARNPVGRQLKGRACTALAVRRHRLLACSCARLAGARPPPPIRATPLKTASPGQTRRCLMIVDQSGPARGASGGDCFSPEPCLNSACCPGLRPLQGSRQQPRPLQRPRPCLHRPRPLIQTHCCRRLLKRMPRGHWSRKKRGGGPRRNSRVSRNRGPSSRCATQRPRLLLKRMPRPHPSRTRRISASTPVVFSIARGNALASGANSIDAAPMRAADATSASLIETLPSMAWVNDRSLVAADFIRKRCARSVEMQCLRGIVFSFVRCADNPVPESAGMNQDRRMDVVDGCAAAQKP